jgi:hypothetical protein
MVVQAAVLTVTKLLQADQVTHLQHLLHRDLMVVLLTLRQATAQVAAVVVFLPLVLRLLLELVAKAEMVQHHPLQVHQLLAVAVAVVAVSLAVVQAQAVQAAVEQVQQAAELQQREL